MAGLTSILETVPPVPGACEQEVKDAQATLTTIAEGLEDLQVLLQWLQPRADECCIALEPDLAAVLG